MPTVDGVLPSATRTVGELLPPCGLAWKAPPWKDAPEETRALDKSEEYLHSVAMATAKLFQHGGSQAVRLPKDFRFEGTEVEIEKRGDEVVLRPRSKPQLKTLADVARFMHESFPEGRDFPDREQPLRPQIRDLDLDQDQD